MTLCTVAHQAPLSVEFSRQEYWSASPFPCPEDLPCPGIKLRCIATRLFTIWATREAYTHTHTHTDFVISMFWYCNYTAKLCKMCLHRRRFNILLQVCISLKNFIENMQMYYYNFLYYAIVTNKNGYDCSKRERDRM